MTERELQLVRAIWDDSLWWQARVALTRAALMLAEAREPGRDVEFLPAQLELPMYLPRRWCPPDERAVEL